MEREAVDQWNLGGKETFHAMKQEFPCAHEKTVRC